ncbi:5'-3' exoribonuclease, partial [Kipferlia bialata]|eukprot:g10259.t1
MNQQRLRRFRAGFDGQKRQKEKRDQGDFGMGFAPKKKDPRIADSNVITPGTQFMQNLSTALRFYVTKRISSDPAWANIRVVFSDSNIPGEGEHKMMQFVRDQRAAPGYDPMTTHVMCGLDADLIMLGLASHESCFTILREVVFDRGMNVCRKCGQLGHGAEVCPHIPPGEETPLAYSKAFQFLHVWRLREYLQFEFSPLMKVEMKMPFDLERIIDDFVFLCFLCGNDFLPHLPSLEINENAIIRMMLVYKELLPTLDGYITDKGDFEFERLRPILVALASKQTKIFRNRHNKEMKFQNRRHQNVRSEIRKPTPKPAAAPKPVSSNMSAAQQLRQRLLSGDSGAPGAPAATGVAPKTEGKGAAKAAPAASSYAPPMDPDRPSHVPTYTGHEDMDESDPIHMTVTWLYK